MTNLVEVAEWIAGIYQIEQADPVLGGPPNLANGEGIANIQAQQLAKRTRWLLENRPALATEEEVLAGLLETKAVSPAFMKAFVAGVIGTTADGLPLNLTLSNAGLAGQNIAPDVPVRCNNMVAVDGNAGALWNGHRFTVDADSLGAYGILNRLNTNNEVGEGAQTWLNGVDIMNYQLSTSAGTANVMPFSHYVMMTTPGDYIEFYHSHKSSGSRTNNGSAAQIFRLATFQPVA